MAVLKTFSLKMEQKTKGRFKSGHLTLIQPVYCFEIQDNSQNLLFDRPQFPLFDNFGGSSKI